MSLMEEVIVPRKERRRSGRVGWILGRVRFEGSPLNYEVLPSHKGKVRVLVGKRGVYVLTDEEVKRLIALTWEEYAKRYEPKRKSAVHPVEVSEDLLFKQLSEGKIRGVAYEALRR